MQPPPDTQPDLQDQIGEALAPALDWRLRVAVTFDGARLPDAQEALDRLGIWGIPLFGGSLSRQQIDSGPWLAVPDLAPAPTPQMPPIADDADPEEAAAQMAEAMRKALENGDETGGGQLNAPDPVRLSVEETRDRLAAFVNAHCEIAPVFWALPEDGQIDALRRHLRRLNVIHLARRPRPRHPHVKGEEEVAFRHADGRVLADVIPVLRREQVAYLVGPAIGLLAAVPDQAAEGADRVIHLSQPALREGETLPDVRPVLTLDASQVDALEDIRAASLDAILADHLARNSDDAAKMAPDTRLTAARDLRRTVYARTTLRADAHVRDLVDILWAHGAGILDHPRVAAVLARPGWSQERKCTFLRDKLLVSQEEVA